jgi:DNA processing protein
MDERKALIALNMIPGIGSIKLNRLIGKFKSVPQIFSAEVQSLCSVEGIGRELAKSIMYFNSKLVEKEILEAQSKGIRIVTIKEEGYPEILKTIYDPPPVLYMAGKEIENADINVGIVGTRDSTEYGIMTTQKIVDGMKQSGISFSVISGMARGIDSVSHTRAAEKGIYTAAVLGFGLNRIFPFERNAMARTVLKTGTLISEFPLNMLGLKQNFPRRNRVISGLSDCVLVIEAGERSGTLITADCALEQGREVFAVPGSIFSVKSKGANNLIKQGAYPVTEVIDIIHRFGLETKSEVKKVNRAPIEKPVMNKEENMVYSILSSEKKQIDVISTEIGMEIKNLSKVLTFMEIKGIVRQLNGKNFVLMK